MGGLNLMVARRPRWGNQENNKNANLAPRQECAGRSAAPHPLGVTRAAERKLSPRGRTATPVATCSVGITRQDPVQQEQAALARRGELPSLLLAIAGVVTVEGERVRPRVGEKASIKREP